MEWEPTEGNREGEGSNAGLPELLSFSHYLMALEICIQNPLVIPKRLSLQKSYDKISYI